MSDPALLVQLVHGAQLRTGVVEHEAVEATEALGGGGGHEPAGAAGSAKSGLAVREPLTLTAQGGENTGDAVGVAAPRAPSRRRAPPSSTTAPPRPSPTFEYATASWVDWSRPETAPRDSWHDQPVEFEQAHYAALNREPQPV